MRWNRENRKKQHVRARPLGLMFLTLAACVAMAWEVAGDDDRVSREQLARWNINYASYLIDVGKYFEALESYDTAFESSAIANTRKDALLAKAMLLSSFLDAPEEAVKVYKQIISKYPQGAEIALYRQGLLLYDLGKGEDARRVLSQYLKKYPKGQFSIMAETLLSMLKKAPAAPARPRPRKVKMPDVRIRIGDKTQELTVSGSPEGSKICSEGLDCLTKYTLGISGNEVTADGKPASGRELKIRAEQFLTVSSGKEGKVLRGVLQVKVQDGGLVAVDIVDMESYLLSVVPSESPASWPMDALKAQAVAARTYAYYQVLHREGMDYDLVDDEGDQVYGGVSREHPRSSQAVRDTHGQILLFDNRPILAMYTADNGGYTADAGSVFKLSKPYLIAKPDPESAIGPMAHWTKSFTAAEIGAALKQIGIRTGRIKDIVPVETDQSGRVITVRIDWDGGSKTLPTRTSLRRALKLPEILFKIEKEGDSFVIKGQGEGHGVGYSQWGGAALGASEGFSKILAFYYPGSRLEEKW